MEMGLKGAFLDGYLWGWASVVPWQATQNPGMFTDAMSMLSDPSAVKEAEAMMNDPEFKSEISQYMETLKNNSAFREAMAEAQRKYQARAHFFVTSPFKSTRFSLFLSTGARRE